MRREEANRGGRPGTRRAFVCFRSRGSPPSSNSSFVFASIAHVLARAPRARRSENSRPREGAPKEMRAGRWDGQVPPLPTAPLRCVRARTMPRDARGPRANARESSGAPLQAPGPRATCANRERGPRGNAVRASRGPRCLFSRVVQEMCSRVCGRERLAANRRSANPDFQRNLEPEKVDSFGERKSFKPRKEPGPVSISLSPHQLHSRLPARARAAAVQHRLFSNLARARSRRPSVFPPAMARGVSKTLSVRPPPQAWLANCLDPSARVVTVSAKEMGAMVVDAAAKSAGRGGGAKRGRGAGSAAKYTVTEKDGFVWVQCDSCSKWRYAPEDKVDKSKPDAKWKVRERTRPTPSRVAAARWFRLAFDPSPPIRPSPTASPLRSHASAVRDDAR